MSIFEFINTIVENVMNDLGAFAPVLACFLIIIESIFPILPLSLFIAINAYYMGYIPGFIISYVLTCVGCYISYSFCSNKLKTHYYNMLDKTEHRKLKRFTKQIQKLKLEELSLIIAMPFTPARKFRYICHTHRPRLPFYIMAFKNSFVSIQSIFRMFLFKSIYFMLKLSNTL